MEAAPALRGGENRNDDDNLPVYQWLYGSSTNPLGSVRDRNSAGCPMVPRTSPVEDRPFGADDDHNQWTGSSDTYSRTQHWRFASVGIAIANPAE